MSSFDKFNAMQEREERIQTLFTQLVKGLTISWVDTGCMEQADVERARAMYETWLREHNQQEEASDE